MVKILLGRINNSSKGEGTHTSEDGGHPPIPFVPCLYAVVGSQVVHGLEPVHCVEFLAIANSVDNRWSLVKKQPR